MNWIRIDRTLVNVEHVVKVEYTPECLEPYHAATIRLYQSVGEAVHECAYFTGKKADLAWQFLCDRYSTRIGDPKDDYEWNEPVEE